MFKTLTAAVALLACASTAHAGLQKVGQFGDWQTFAGISNDNTTAMCVAGLTGPSRSLYVNYQQDKDIAAVQLYKEGWKIPQGTKIEIVLQVDQAPPMRLIAIGGHNSTTGQDFLQAPIGASDIWEATGKPMITELMSMIGDGNTVRFYFPSGNEKPWEGSLNGSRAAMVNLSQCVTYVASAKSKPAPTQPFGAAPSTQPFTPAARSPLAEVPEHNL
jgi:hypothetical protein